MNERCEDAWGVQGDSSRTAKVKTDKIVSSCSNSLEEEEGDIDMHTRMHAKLVRVGLTFLGEAGTLLRHVLLQGPHSNPGEAHAMKLLRNLLPGEPFIT